MVTTERRIFVTKMAPISETTALNKCQLANGTKLQFYALTKSKMATKCQKCKADTS